MNVKTIKYWIVKQTIPRCDSVYIFYRAMGKLLGIGEMFSSGFPITPRFSIRCFYAHSDITVITTTFICVHYTKCGHICTRNVLSMFKVGKGTPRLSQPWHVLLQPYYDHHDHSLITKMFHNFRSRCEIEVRVWWDISYTDKCIVQTTFKPWWWLITTWSTPFTKVQFPLFYRFLYI